MEELNPKVYEIFAEKLRKRLEHLCSTWDDVRKNKGDPLSEDDIRYIFYSSLIPYYEDSKILLEFPFGYPDKDNLNYELDGLLRTDAGNYNYAFEIKYHRNFGISKLNTTTLAASVISDLIRLKYFCNQYLTSENTKRYFIYLTDREMDDYFKNKTNKLDGFYINDSFEFDKNPKENTKTFQKAIKFKLEDGDTCSVSKVHEALLPKEYVLKIWEVR